MHSSGLAVFIDFIGKIKNFFQFFVISLKYQKSRLVPSTSSGQALSEAEGCKT